MTTPVLIGIFVIVIAVTAARRRRGG